MKVEEYACTEVIVQLAREANPKQTNISNFATNTTKQMAK